MSIAALQKKIGATPDGDFGPKSLKAAMVYFKMSKERAAHFFGQCAHETGGFNLFVENLNYSAVSLEKIFGKYFPGALAESYQRQPERIANRVYASRMGNSDEKSGDGWKYRGRGAVQLTGKDNYKAFSEYMKKPEILTNPDLVSTEYSFESAIFFFDRNKLWSLCSVVNTESITKLSKAINLGSATSKATPHGLDDRILKTNQFYKILSI